MRLPAERLVHERVPPFQRAIVVNYFNDEKESHHEE
jgi:hypothetical protein